MAEENAYIQVQRGEGAGDNLGMPRRGLAIAAAGAPSSSAEARGVLTRVPYVFLTAAQSLTDEAGVVEEDLQEAEAKNRLYTLLLERTRREHMAIDQRARARARGGGLAGRGAPRCTRARTRC